MFLQALQGGKLHRKILYIYTYKVDGEATMHDETSLLPHSASHLLMQAALEIPLGELKSLVSDSIQYGPPIRIHLDGPLTRIEQATTPANSWVALLEFTGWGVGAIAHEPGTHSTYLLANSAHLERVLRIIARRLESCTGQRDQQAEIKHQKPAPPIKPPRKHDNSPELG